MIICPNIEHPPAPALIRGQGICGIVGWKPILPGMARKTNNTKIIGDDMKKMKNFRFLLFIAIWLAFSTAYASWAANNPPLVSTDRLIAKATKASAENTRVEVTRVVLSEVAQYFGLAQSRIDLDTDLYQDLLGDHMDVFELVSRISDLLGKKIGVIEEIHTVGDLIKHIQKAPSRPKSATRGLDKKKKERGTTPSKAARYSRMIFYSTDRARIDDTDEKQKFGGGRSIEPLPLSYGTCLVSIPPSHRKGRLELPKLFFDSLDPNQHFVLEQVDVLEEDRFFNLLNKTLKNPTASEDTSDDILIFTHGYNVTFARAALRTAQIAVDLDFKGAPMLFSWPSDGKLFSYFSDREDVEWSALHLEQFLMALREKSRWDKIHLVAHSMGNQALIRALYQIALRLGDQKNPLFDNVILAAPDFDARYFTEQIAPQITFLAKRWTIYESNKDTALQVSNILRQKASPRLGQPLALVDGIDTVNATESEVTPWNLPENHSYFATKSTVIKDLMGVIRGLSPFARGLLIQLQNGKSYWRLKYLPASGE